MKKELIRELMSKTLDEKFAGTWSTMDMQDLAKFSERFAELIVQECAEVIFETPVKYTEIDIMHIIRDRVKEHFDILELNDDRI